MYRVVWWRQCRNSVTIKMFTLLRINIKVTWHIETSKNIICCQCLSSHKSKLATLSVPNCIKNVGPYPTEAYVYYIYQTYCTIILGVLLEICKASQGNTTFSIKFNMKHNIYMVLSIKCTPAEILYCARSTISVKCVLLCFAKRHLVLTPLHFSLLINFSWEILPTSCFTI